MRRALTLFEVLVSLLMVSVGMLTVIALLPGGMKIQAQVRYQAYASAIALSLADSFHNPIPTLTHLNNQTASLEGNNNTVANLLIKPPIPGYASRLRQACVYSAPLQPDFERYLSGWITGVMPVPTEIARRLDSPDDEIGRLLDAGGQIYYVDPAFVRGLSQSERRSGLLNASSPSPEVHKLVFAVAGSAQQNALTTHPFESWPLYEIYPFAPQYASISRGQTRLMIRRPDPLLPGQRRYGDGGKITDDLGVNNLSDLGQHAGRYHGRNWLYFRDTFAGRWTDGWIAFLRLSGDFERSGNSYTRFAFPRVIEIPRLVRGGWLSIAACFPAPSSAYANMVDPEIPKNRLNLEDPGLDGALCFPTFAMRLNYLDRAMYLWNQVRPASIAELMPTVVPIVAHPENLFTASDKAPPGGVMSEFTYKPDALANYLADTVGALSDPYALPPGDFPPHPAQVLALSYLAHAAMMVTGYQPPFNAPTYNGRGDPTPSATWGTFTPMDWDTAKKIPFHPKVGPLDPGCNPANQPPCWPMVAISAADWPTNAATFATMMQKYRGFARQIHEMSLRWAICYAHECPADWGAPRPANSQLMIDKPLALFDLFYDAGRTSGTGSIDGAANGIAQRTLRNVASTTLGSQESFYRWMGPPNPVAYATAGPRGISHLGPNGHSTGSSLVWQSLSRNPQLTPPPPSDPAYASSEDERYWLNRPFDPSWRGRQLVFWATDWKSYVDAETAPSAPIDLSRYTRWINGTGAITRIEDNSWQGVFTAHPERQIIWKDQTRTERCGPSDTSDPDRELGHWGADRNGNARCDRGPVPATVRMRAEPVSRFALYDPVLRLAVSP